jgi:hypothetical protein
MRLLIMAVCFAKPHSLIYMRLHVNKLAHCVSIDDDGIFGRYCLIGRVISRLANPKIDDAKVS